VTCGAVTSGSFTNESAIWAKRSNENSSLIYPPVYAHTICPGVLRAAMNGEGDRAFRARPARRKIKLLMAGKFRPINRIGKSGNGNEKVLDVCTTQAAKAKVPEYMKAAAGGRIWRGGLEFLSVKIAGLQGSL
jgi:hypothetical protein